MPWICEKECVGGYYYEEVKSKKKAQKLLAEWALDLNAEVKISFRRKK